jgi:glycosyltransferase involved in cell wall biosynthesis
MNLLSSLSALLKKLWRFVYFSFIDILKRIIPEPAKKYFREIRYRLKHKNLLQNQDKLRHILQEKQAGKGYRTIIIFPPALEFNVDLFQRPMQLALALAKRGALVFYIQPQPDRKQEPFQLISERLYVCPIDMDTFRVISNAVIYLVTWNSDRASWFTQPRILYDYIDDINVFFGDYHLNVQGHQFLLQNANYVLATARKLFDEVRLQRPDVIYSPNAVVYEHFSRAARREFPSPPSDMQAILAKSKPVIGYYGALARWFDYDLLKDIASLRPEYQFVLIGPDFDGTILGADVMNNGNIHWLGAKPHGELPHYLQYFDVATIPFIVSDITHATSPIKLFEYMAGEKPVVITPMQESMHYPGVLIGENAVQFTQQLDVALQLREDEAYLNLIRQTALDNTWDHRAEEILSVIEKEL